MYFATYPPKTRNHVGTAAMISAENLAKILGIEPRGKGGRSDKVAKHHCELAPLSISRW